MKKTEEQPYALWNNALKARATLEFFGNTEEAVTALKLIEPMIADRIKRPSEGSSR